MPQETNLNVSPYYDDFNEDKNFNRVLFKPASPVQARELTQLQSILQNQIERFGQHFFKEGAMVIPGQIAYDPLYYAVEVNPTFLGVPVSEYLDQLVGKVIRGSTSGVEATVVNYILSSNSDRGNNTIYVKYSKSGSDFATNTFQDGENLVTASDIEYGLSRITANNPFASCIPSNATSTGCAASIQEGVYFIRGFFVKVLSQTVILDQYDATPSYRVGLFVKENIVTAYDDSSLFDNARGFSNFSAPGADRFQIETTLIKKGLDEFNDENFVELMRLDNGDLQKFVKKTDYNLIRDELARRTYDESGDYYVKPFQVSVKESLNNRLGNGGVYLPNQKTAQGSVPSKDLMLYQVSPGKAYVRGFDIEKLNTSYIDVEKPRDTKTISGASFAFDGVNFVKINNVYGSPVVGFGTTAVVSLRSERIGSTASAAGGIEIGNAKVYDYKLEASAYSNDTSKYEVYLYDLQTFSEITVSSNITQTTPAFIEGARSGARGYLKSNVSNSQSLTLTSTNGQFIVDEPIIINGIEDTRVVTSVREYSFDDIKSVYQTVGINTFNADLVLSNRFSLAPSGTNFTIGSAGIVTAPGNRFSVGIKTGDIVTYNRTGFSDPTFNRVGALSADGSTITLVSLGASVSGVCDGGLTTTEIQTSDFSLIRPNLVNGNRSTLATRLPNSYISNVDLTGSEIQIRRQFSLNVSGSRATVTVSATDQFFQPFDEERYNLVYSDGTVEPLTAQKVTFNSTFKTVTLAGLSKSNDTNAILVATLKKINVTSQAKNLARCTKLVVNRSKYEYSGSTSTTFNDGLTYNTVYGTRVQDKEICLNVPDALRVHAVFESSTTSAPILPNITLVNRSSTLTNTLQGELVVGATSGAVARVVTSSTTNVDIVYKNELRFVVGEVVNFQSSGISGEVSTVVIGDKNIVTNFTFDNGQRSEFYDYSRIIRSQNASEPKKQIAIIYDNFVVDSGSGGDLVTVNSYSPDTYENDQSLFKGEPIVDYIDIRPRVKNYNLASDTDSPFEYDFRDFSSSGGYVPNNLVGDETLTIGYSYYLPRIDKIFLSKDGFFELKKGIASDNPIVPETPAGAFTVATVYNKAYLHNATKESSVVLAKHKRYTMFDISRLESRIKNIEFYTQLSLLETDTANLNIRDAVTGLDRFKSGFFVDNFRGHSSHSITHPNFRASIDKAQGQLRPMHYTHGVDLLLGSEQVVGIGTTANPNADLSQVSDLQSNNLRRTGDVVTLNYTESAFITQNFATRTENVNPFAVINWVGVAQLNPTSDVWLDENRLEVNNLVLEGGYQSFLDAFAVDPNTGFAPIDWGSWEEEWSSVDVSTTELSRELQSSEVVGASGWSRGWTSGGQTLPQESQGLISRTRNVNMQDNFLVNNEAVISVDRGLTRTGIQLQVNERVDTQSLGTRLISRETIPYLRSRNIEFVSNRIKPRTRFYVFFEDQDVTQYVTPKLLEISMTQGVFQVGETVKGNITNADASGGVSPEITFRVARPNHKYGSYDSPTIIYNVNPYSDTVGLGSVYSATSSVLNIDTASLQSEVLGSFSGYAAKNMKLVGQTSGAEATVTDMRLISDEKGVLIGTLFIPNSTLPTAPQFTTGTKTFRITSSVVNSLSPVDNPSTAETSFYAEGVLDTLQDDVIGIRNVDVQRETVTDSTVTNQTVTRTVQTQAFEDRTVSQNQWYDPLAESFEVVEDNGVFVSSCDIFFQTKDTNIPVTLQIRTMQTGLPTNTILPFGEVVYEPSQVNVSENGTVATRFTFPSPVYLAGKKEYALVLLSASNNYRVYISRMGEEDLSSANLPESEKIIVSQQPYMGSLFKSQNGSTWDPSQLEDLKFVLNKCAFVPGPGTLKLYNPELGVGKFENAPLRPQPLEFYSHEIQVGFGSTVATRDFSVGSKFTQVGNRSAEGNLVKSLGAIKINTSATEAGGITTNRVGTGLTPSASNFTYTGIALTSITGNGSGAVANIQVVSGSIGVVTVTSGGSGYAVGDVLGCNLGETGSNTRFNVGIVSATNSIVLDRVQGEFTTSSELMTINAVGVASTLPGSQPSAINNTATYKDGLHVKVNHRNHGMHARNNRVTISGVTGVTSTTTVSTQYSNTSTTDLDVGSVNVFSSFENVGVSTTNPGYIKINNEILSYTGVNAGSTPRKLTGIGRGVDGTVSETHNVGDIVQKYEAAGISLRRINTTHQFSSVNNSNEITLDSYYVKINTTSSGIGTVRDGTNSFRKLKISDTEINGGFKAKATQNIQFEAVTPLVEFLTPRDTGLGGRVRTVSGTSANGSETSFQDQGFENVTLNGINYFDTPRIISSKINEQNQLTSLPGGKSFTMELVLSSQDQNVSPVIDLDRLAVITTTNRLDQRVTNYPDDSRVNERFNDPNAAVYITKRVNLENPATFLQVRFGAYRHVSNDIRVLYRLLRTDTLSQESTYELFPGYDNMTDTTGDGFGDQVIDPKLNNGKPDRFVPASSNPDNFRDYQFTASNLPEFNGFEIKVIMTGTNQAYVPKIRDFRAIAFA
jgi:hypothetical protein